MPEEKPGGKRVRSPAYPGVSLPKAIEYAQAFYAKEHKHAAAPAIAARAMGFTDHKSGAAGTALAALKKFGLLLEDEKGQVHLSPWALDIILAPSEDHAARLKAIREAALAPVVYRELWEKWNGRLPSDQNIGYYLERERSFNPNVIRSFIKDFRATVEFAGLNSGATGESSGEHEQDETGEDGAGGNQGRRQRRRAMQAGMKEATLPLDVGEVVVQWPEQISPDEVEDIEGWIEVVIRKIKRAAQARGEEPTEE
jgi:hypothetical protein